MAGGKETSSSEVTSASSGAVNPIQIDGFEAPFQQITSHKFNGQNFVQWSHSVMMFIEGKGKEDYLTGDAAQPDEKDPKFKTWKTENSMVRSWLINSMNTEMGENFMYYKTPKEMWDAVKRSYSNRENTSEIFRLKGILNDLHQGELNVMEYFNTLSRHWQQLDILDETTWHCAEDHKRYKEILERDRVYKFLLGLNKTLDDVRGRILSTKPLPDMLLPSPHEDHNPIARTNKEETGLGVIIASDPDTPKIVAGKSMGN
ncbi:uncharacterized protein LOC112090889 [Morus notabilis]|uniref:uncharacterized protein LOC112090889 n=1 Tax=Morus notabilis TaxID=981085 RepID=UPI000CED383C|nr:uncharacterized protein LOC112090889 [Morus notabilis]